jgi:O-antigen/teichoic acid export membrane protein
VLLAAGIALMVPFGVVGAVGGLAASQIAATAFAGIRVLALPGARAAMRARARLSELRRGVAFGSKPWLGEVFWLLNFRIDVLILNAYVSPALTLS